MKKYYSIRVLEAESRLDAINRMQLGEACFIDDDSKSDIVIEASQYKIIKKRKTANKNIKLYYHKTDGGAEYLMDTYLKWNHEGKSGREGVINDKTKYIVRIDGDIKKDCELIIK